jgi:uncharacterized protein YsxB (DUF464 family)
MVEISFSEDSDYRRIVVDGHAGYAEKGKDIICAAVSALVLTYKEFMVDLEQEGKARVNSYLEIDGHIDIASDNISIESQTAYAITKSGLENISYTYPGNVKICEKNS